MNERTWAERLERLELKGYYITLAPIHGGIAYMVTKDDGFGMLDTGVGDSRLRPTLDDALAYAESLTLTESE